MLYNTLFRHVTKALLLQQRHLAHTIIKMHYSKFVEKASKKGLSCSVIQQHAVLVAAAAIKARLRALFFYLRNHGRC
jgi:hypothetical protein